MIAFQEWLIDRASVTLDAARRTSIGTIGLLVAKRGGRLYQHQDGAPDMKQTGVPEAAGDRLEIERLREEHHDSLYAVDPYDVLARPSESGFKTPFERDDASNINPQPRP
jgi:hypothetical protein